MPLSGCSSLLMVVMVILDVTYSSDTDKPAYSSEWSDHQAQHLTNEELTLITSRTDFDNFNDKELTPLLIPRVPGTKGSEAVRNHIISRLNSLDMWRIEQDKFTEETPAGPKEFVNVVATLRPNIERRLVLACHYDSKYFLPSSYNEVFIGATDSAVPCAMLLDLANNLADLLKNTTQVSTNLQLIFFDGNEAFKEWTKTDSLYGSRHLADKMSNTSHPPGANTTQIDSMDMLVLLSLIGTKTPPLVFRNAFRETSSWFKHLAGIEVRLLTIGAISDGRHPYFPPTLVDSRYLVEDDHIPFLERNVRVMHLIPLPFPNVWHTVSDNADALDPTTIDDLNKILQVFVVEYMHLLDSQPS